jgi:hypothetical protein
LFDDIPETDNKNAIKTMTRVISCFQSPFCLASFLFVFTGFAPAATIDVTGVNGNLGLYNIDINQAGNDVPIYFAGVINITLTSPDLEQYYRNTMCVDLYTDIYIGGTYNTNVVTPAEVPGRNLEQVAWLLDNALVPTQDDGASSVLPQSDWVESAVQGAGLQVALWDLTTPGGVQSAGDYTTSDWQYWANYYESLVGPGTIGTTSDLAFVYENWDGNGTAAQMLEGPVFLDGGPSPQPAPPLLGGSIDPPAAPEPASYGLVGAALIGLALGPRLRTRRALAR